MGWSIGFDTRWNRDIGYGVPAYCDHPGCNKEIDRGLSHVCGGEPCDYCTDRLHANCSGGRTEYFPLCFKGRKLQVSV